MNARITFKNIQLHKLTNFSFKDVTAACKSFIENAGASECVIVQTASRVEVFTVGGIQTGEYLMRDETSKLTDLRQRSKEKNLM